MAPIWAAPRGAAGMMPGEKAKNFKGTMAKLLRYLSRYLPAIITVLVCAAASTVFSIFGPKVLGQATTKLFEGVMAMLTGHRRHRFYRHWANSSVLAGHLSCQRPSQLCAGLGYGRRGHQGELFHAARNFGKK